MYSKFVTNFVMGLKIWSQVGELGFDFQNYHKYVCFLKIMLKVRFPKNTSDNRPFFNFLSNLSKILIFSENSFKGISFVKLTPFTFLSSILSFSEISFKGISFIKLNPRLVLFDVWWDGVGSGRVGRESKVSFNFLHSLWVYRSCICSILIYMK